MLYVRISSLLVVCGCCGV